MSGLLSFLFSVTRWKEIEPGTWRSVLAGSIWTLKQTDTHISYQIHNPSTHQEVKTCGKSGDGPRVQSQRKKRGAAQNQDCGSKKRQKMTLNGGGDESGVVKGAEDDEKSSSAILRDYLQLDVNLGELYSQWQKADKNFSKVSESFPGVRILRQDPVENLVSFICSSNNNIARITGMVEKLCQQYGDEVRIFALFLSLFLDLFLSLLVFLCQSLSLYSSLSFIQVSHSLHLLSFFSPSLRLSSYLSSQYLHMNSGFLHIFLSFSFPLLLFLPTPSPSLPSSQKCTFLLNNMNFICTL